MMKRSAYILLLTALLPAGLSGQEDPVERLTEVLPADVAAQVIEQVEAARARALSGEAVANLALEGVASLRRKAIRHIDLTFDREVSPEPFAALAGTSDVVAAGNRITLSFDGHMQDLLEVATNGWTLVDIATEEADLEEIFLTYYRDDERTPRREEVVA